MKKSKCSCATKWGLIGGMFLALIHAVWSLLIAITPQGIQQFLNWAISLHSLAVPYTVQPFQLINAIQLVIVTFVSGFVFGWVLKKIVEFVYEKC